jgi:heme A synthase
VFTSTEWGTNFQDVSLSDGSRLRRLCTVTTVVIYIQSVFGAVLRHTGERLDAHLFFAAMVVLHVLFISVRILRSHSDQPKLTRPAGLLTILLLLQLSFGVASYFGKFTSLLRLTVGALVVVTTTHLVIGAVMLATSLVLTLRCYRFSTTSKASARPELLREQISV